MSSTDVLVSNQRQVDRDNAVFGQNILNAVLHLRKERTQCNLQNIYKYLKQNYPFNVIVQTLTQKDLANHLDESVLVDKTSSGKQQETRQKIKIQNHAEDQRENEQQISTSLNSTTMKTPINVQTQQIMPFFVNAKEVTLVLIRKLFDFYPPFTPAQIIAIESLKKQNLRMEICSFCLSTENKNLKRFDHFLSCCDCGLSCHPYCIKYSEELINYLQEKSIKWQCLECKKCCVCFETCDSLLLCDRCDRGYHNECCNPKLNKPPKGVFICHVCKEMTLIKENKNLDNN
jgi:hypothetical protein